jgi:hypothetical protein
MAYDEDYQYDDNFDELGGDFVQFNTQESYLDESDYSSVSTNRKKHRKYVESAKNIDRGYHRLKRYVDYKKTFIEIYSTPNQIGAMIRDAVTGSRYKEYRVGSYNEDRFFKIVIATGELGQNGGTFFFNSPEEYERHFKNIYSIQPSDKVKWVNKMHMTIGSTVIVS